MERYGEEWPPYGMFETFLKRLYFFSRLPQLGQKYLEARGESWFSDMVPHPAGGSDFFLSEVRLCEVKTHRCAKIESPDFILIIPSWETLGGAWE